MKKTTITLFIAAIFFAIACQKAEMANPKNTDRNAKVAAAMAITEIVPINGTANGYTYNDVQKEFAKWILTPGFNDGPLADPDGARHTTALQPLSGISILASNFGGESTRSTTVPAGNYIYLPVFGGTAWKYRPTDDLCDHSKIPAGHPLKSFLNAVINRFSANQKPSGLIAKVDEMDIVTDLTKYLSITSPFPLSPHNDFNNPACDYTGKIATAVDMSFGIIIKLSPGVHTIYYSGLSTNKQFYSGVTWNITVE